MASELDQFSTLFASERELQQTLLQLLGKLDGVNGVRLLQGPTERGKDIVFYHQTPFGTKRLIACVVKNTAITGSVGSSGGARTVLFQCQQAFDSPYTNARGDEERVEHVYVISPHSSSPDAMDSIKGGLQHRSGQVTFLCGSDLLDVFKQRWPAFLAFNGDFLGRYLNDLRLRIDTNPVSSALALRHSIIAPATRMLSTIYVPQQLTVQLGAYTERPLSWYTDLLESRTSLAEVQDAQFNLSVLISVLTSATLWGTGPEVLAWTDAGQALRRVSKVLLSLWDSAYEDLVRSHKGDRLLSQSAALVHLAPNATLRSEYRVALKAARECWAAFGRRLSDERSQIQQYPKDALAIISYPPFPKHCAITEVANRAYLAIAKASTKFVGKINADCFANVSHSLLITAPAGFGKTSMCQYHALQDADSLLKGDAATLPIYVALHEIAQGTGKSFSDLFLRSENLRQVIESGDSGAVPFRRIRLYLDGLDEVADYGRRRLIVLEALSKPLAWPLQVIITARDHVYDDYLTTLPRLCLSPFSSDEMHRFISLWLEEDHNGIAQVEGHLRRNAALRDLAAIPLIGTIVVGVYRKLRQIPETKVALYEACVDLLCGGWDFVKNVQRGGRYSPAVKMTILKTLAGQLHARRLRHAAPQDVQQALGFSLNRLEPEYEAIVDEIVQDGLLARTGRILMFSHLSFQEFLAAKDLADPSGRKQASALRRYMLGDDWWKEVLIFYIGLLNDPYAAHVWMGSVIRGIARSKGNSVDVELKSRTATLEDTIRVAYPDFKAQPILR